MARKSRKDRLQAWFDKGADALARVRPDLPRGYGCPVCLRLIPTLESLSEEHVPPESVGGHPLILTCRECNSRAGFELDHHLGKAEAFKAVVAGEGSVRGRFTHYGQTLNADLTFGPEPSIRILEQNDPAVITAVRNQLTSDIEAKVIPPEMQLEFGSRHSIWREHVAWLRVGYLFAFAALGYRFALQEVLAPVRKQITQPGERLVSGLVREVKPHVPRCIAFVRAPDALRSVLVSLGERVILLPGLGDDIAFYERMGEGPKKGEGFHVTAPAHVDLPRHPVFWFDFDRRALPTLLRSLWPPDDQVPADG